MRTYPPNLMTLFQLLNTKRGRGIGSIYKVLVEYKRGVLAEGGFRKWAPATYTRIECWNYPSTPLHLSPRLFFAGGDHG